MKLALRGLLFGAAWSVGALIACSGDGPWTNGGGSGGGGNSTIGTGSSGGAGASNSSSGGATTDSCTISCNVDQDCKNACGTPSQSGYVWCCMSPLCYTWSTACPNGTGSSSGGRSASSSSGGGVVDAGREGGRGRCASPDTPIATPDGFRPIAQIRAGDLVYSVDHGSIRPVVVLQVGKVFVEHHHVVHVRLADGRTIDMSPNHPTADGRVFSELRAGGALDGQSIASADLVLYMHDATYDILPASDTGSYFAAGVQVGSTLAEDGESAAQSSLPRSSSPLR